MQHLEGSGRMKVGYCCRLLEQKLVATNRRVRHVHLSVSSGNVSGTGQAC
jgi:hypothetical protein